MKKDEKKMGMEHRKTRRREGETETCCCGFAVIPVLVLGPMHLSSLNNHEHAMYE